MKQVLQNLASGETTVQTVPEPLGGPTEVVIRTRATLISTGTEKMLVDFGKANFISKARQQPDKVRQVLDKIKTDGLAPTIETVRNKLNQPLATGYCNVGVVEKIGSKISSDFEIGNRVVSNGKHAGVVAVPQNLCAKIPENVSDEEAAFTVVGAIGLQGVRLIEPTLGECVVVVGLGLIGLLTVQLLRAHGCRVLGVDFDSSKVAMARTFGADTVDLSAGEDPFSAANKFSRNRGVDAVIITASTSSNEPVHQAATMCRKRGRIVLVGVVGLELSRADFFEKELSFQVSCSYGPGRYDSEYEEKGNDYPVGYVRWTEQRNFEAFLDMLAMGSVDVRPLISHRFSIDAATDAYDLISSNEPSLGILLDFGANGVHQNDSERLVKLESETASNPTNRRCEIGFIGAGNYATQVLIPAFAQSGAKLKTVVSASGVSAVHIGKKLGIENASTDADLVYADEEVNSVVITTRHDSHAALTIQAIDSGKNVFVEKPLALDLVQLEEIQTAYAKCAMKPLVMVGFNRRFAPQIIELKRLLEAANQPKSFVITINAGNIPSDHWTQDPEMGGGRIIGEGCHFIDLMRHLAGARITGLQAIRMGKVAGVDTPDDKAGISMAFADGSHGTIHYLANGNKAFPKETNRSVLRRRHHSTG